MAWRQQILDYLERQICLPLMVSQPQHAFENDLDPNSPLNLLKVHNSGDKPVTLETSDVREDQRFWAPRIPNPCGSGTERFNTPLRHFFSRPVDDKDLTGAEETDRVPAIYLQAFGGRQDTGSQGMSTPEPGRLDHQIEYLTFIIHGIFRDRTTRDSAILNPHVTAEMVQGGMSDTWLGNGNVWRDLKNRCEFIPGLPDQSSVPTTRWQLIFTADVECLLPTHITISGNRVLEVHPIGRATKCYDITLETAVADLPRASVTFTPAGPVLASDPQRINYNYWRTMNEQALGFVSDIQSVVSLTHLMSIAPEIEGTRQDTFISNAHWGDWAMLPKAENSPVDQVSLPLIVKVHYPKNP